MTVLACSKGAEVYSINWAIRSVRPDLELRIHAVDISSEILQFAKRGVFSIDGLDTLKRKTADEDVAWNTCRDQNAAIFERMTEEEIMSMRDVEGDQARIKPELREEIVWRKGMLAIRLVQLIGLQDIVVANRFFMRTWHQGMQKDACVASPHL